MRRGPFVAAALGLALGLLTAIGAGTASAAASAPPAGPPYPAAVNGQRVYDYAGIFSPTEIASAEAVIAEIENRTGAQVAVYTQVKPASDSLDKANDDAAALMDQWGVGRKGFDDGLVILFDMQDNLRHGQVSLFAGSGFKKAFLTDSQRQSIFDDDMKPLLVDGGFDQALEIALDDINAAATPEHAAQLEHDRQLNAVVALAGLLGGLFLILIAFLAWLRHGRDPVYIDDSSVLMPAPPAELTPAMATLLMDDRTSERTVTAGLVDLAAHGAVSFRSDVEDGKPVAGVDYLGPGDGTLAAPEHALLDAIAKKAQGHDGYIQPKQMYHLLDAFDDLKATLESTAVAKGWLRSRPGDVMFTWQLVGALEIVAAIVATFVWLISEASGVLVVAVGLAVAGMVTIGLSRYMPARTRQGAMLYAMLAAYKRSMKAQMDGAASMDQVAKAKPMPWIDTPDQAMVWGIALGLNDDVQAVLARSASPAWEQDPGTPPAWHPSWWMYSTSHPSHSAFAAAAGATVAAGSGGMFSATPLPDPGALLASLHTISHASSPAGSGSSSGSSSFSSGGFGGGRSSGGGGAGGGF